MKIRLGRELDGQHGDIRTAQLDAATMGPLGMLNLLETQLGLLRIETPQTVRILHYRDCLKRLDHEERFYHRSFANDPLGTAATLLDWRDQWYLHSWCGPQSSKLDESPSRRLRDMVAVEVEALRSVPPSVGERLQAIAQAMAEQPPRISRIQLCEALSSWPKAWQDILSALPCEEITIQHADAPHASPTNTLLGELQSALSQLAREEKPIPLRWREDGSIRIVQAETTLLAGRWLADQLAESARSQALADDTLILAQETGCLDEILVASHLPRQGLQESSPFRPALQVVPLALAQLWAPIDIYGLLKFLTHPICPVPGLVRHPLATLLATSPGLGQGPAWNKTMQEIEANCARSGYAWEKARERINTWVLHPRHDPALGAPLSAVTECLSRLAAFFRSRLEQVSDAERSAFSSGQGQALACRQAVEELARQGETHIRPQQLQTLIQQATAQGSPNPLLQAQVGACRSITTPGAAIDPAREIIWWQMSAPPLTSPWPWSLSEQAALRADGVALPDIGTLLEQQAATWQRPIFAARERLTLVLPPAGNEVHPLWLLLISLFAQESPPSVVSLELQLTANGQEIQPYRPLSARRRYWQLPEGSHIPKREKESYSSLESFLFNPYQWVLTYPARLKRSVILDVSDGFLLYGNLAHHLVEHYVTLPDALNRDESALLAWFDPAFESLIAEEGAVLLMPGRREELESFRRKLREALCQLCRHLLAARIVRVEPEVRLTGQFSGGRIEGFGDLLLTREDGSQAIVDMKWAGGKKYPEKLAHNRHLQLVIYGELLRQKTGNWPQLAYYLLNDAELIATDRNFFPSARDIRKSPEVGDEGNPHLWQRFLKTWAWRREQLDAGLIEIALEASDDSDAPADGMALEILNQNYNDYLALAGWGEDA